MFFFQNGKITVREREYLFSILGAERYNERILLFGSGKHATTRGGEKLVCVKSKNKTAGRKKRGGNCLSLFFSGAVSAFFFFDVARKPQFLFFLLGGTSNGSPGAMGESAGGEGGGGTQRRGRYRPPPPEPGLAAARGEGEAFLRVCLSKNAI